jgi:hypothetical protein
MRLRVAAQNWFDDGRDRLRQLAMVRSNRRMLFYVINRQLRRVNHRSYN